MKEFLIDNKKYDTTFININDNKYKEVYLKKYDIIVYSNFNNNRLIDEYLLYFYKKNNIKIENGLKIYVEVIDNDNVKVIESIIIDNILKFNKYVKKEEYLTIKKNNLRNKNFKDFIFFSSIPNKNDDYIIEIYFNNENKKGKKEFILDLEDFKKIKFSKGINNFNKFMYFFTHFFFIILFVFSFFGMKYLANTVIVTKNNKINYFEINKLKKEIKQYNEVLSVYKNIKTQKEILKTLYRKNILNVRIYDLGKIINQSFKEINFYKKDNLKTNNKKHILKNKQNNNININKKDLKSLQTLKQLKNIPKKENTDLIKKNKKMTSLELLKKIKNIDNNIKVK